MKNFRDETLDKKELQIKNRWSPIKFHNSININCLNDIFYNLFNKQLSTYEINNLPQCSKGRGRSYYDCYRLCMHYFPELSFREMYTTLRNLIKKDNPNFQVYGAKTGTPMFWGCPDIGRARFAGVLRFD